MSDVIRFPQFVKSRSQSVSGLKEAQDAADDVKMSDLYGGPGGMAGSQEAHGTDANISFLQHSGEIPTPEVGWSNQELADLYRTQRILAQAGVTTEVDRGITDEGDPWFVFMDGQGEVLVHFSRFDGVYLVSSHLQEAPIKGESLQDLVTQFSNRVRPVDSRQEAPNVVSMARRHRDVVFIHPAAALAALVWSVYLMSDELIAATPMITAGEAEGSDGSLLEPIQMLESETLGEIPVAQTSNPEKAQPAVFDLEFAKQSMASSSSREGLMMGLSGQGAKALGISLSFVALAAGLPLPASNAGEIVKDAAAPEQLSLEELLTALAQVKAEEKELLLASGSAEPEHRETNALVNENEGGLKTALNIDPESETPVVVQLAEPTHVMEADILTGHASVQSAGIAARGEAPVQAKETAESAEGDTQASSTSIAVAGAKEFSFLQSFDEAFKSFEITSLDRLAQDDLFKLLSSEVATGIPDPLKASDLSAPLEETLLFEVFDQQARVYLDFLLQSYSNVKIVNRPTEIIFVHMEAFNDPSGTSEIYTKSWSFDDGGTISTIGLKSDMLEFDLIA
mgnify:CR=1 FL=1